LPSAAKKRISVATIRDRHLRPRDPAHPANSSFLHSRRVDLIKGAVRGRNRCARVGTGSGGGTWWFSPDWLEFCQVFKLRPDWKKYQLEVTKLEPFPVTFPPEGLTRIDLETRSLLQVLFFVAHGVEVPPEHVVTGRARMTIDLDGSVFDYDRVLGGLFKVRSAKCKKRPPGAAVAVPYLDHWYFIEETDHNSRATFALLFYLSKLELGVKSGAAPLFTIPLGK
jgi:hypothetical protein